MKSLSQHRNKTSGFTLIEILVVMLIISIVGGTALLTLSINQNHRIESAAKQLTRALVLAEQQAMLQPAVLGFAHTTRTYAFYRYQEKNNNWLMRDDAVLGSHSLPSNVQLTLVVQGKTIFPADHVNNIIPSLIISTSGDITPFIIYVGKTKHPPLYRIIGETNGSIHNELIPKK